MAVPEEATDEALASRAALGDNHAFDEITIRYQARVYRLACRLVGHDDAPDVVQEGFLSVYRQPRLVPAGVAVRHVALSHRHQRGADAPPGSHTPAGRIAGSVSARIRRDGPPLPHAGGAAGRRACRRTARSARSWRKKRRLPSIDCPTSIAVRSCCAIWKSSRTAEVADVLGVEPATVRQRVHRARLMLRGYLSALAGVKS